jgi:hypothetical protein
MDHPEQTYAGLEVVLDPALLYDGPAPGRVDFDDEVGNEPEPAAVGLASR